MMSMGELRDMLLMLIGRLAGEVDGVEPRLDEKDMVSCLIVKVDVARDSAEPDRFPGWQAVYVLRQMPHRLVARKRRRITQPNVRRYSETSGSADRPYMSA